MRLKLYLLLWWRRMALQIESDLMHRGSAVLYIMGKIVRFLFFLWLIVSVGNQAKNISGYTPDQLVIFLLTFNLIDLLAQIFFRGVYSFKEQVRIGIADLMLMRPVNPLFHALIGFPDPLDLPLFFIVLTALFFQGVHSSLESILMFIVSVIVSFLLMMAMHIFVISVGIMTLEVDNIIMLFRDIWSMGRLPVDIYSTGVRFALTFIIPVAIIMNMPAKALLGLINWQNIFISFVISLCVVQLSLWFWKFSLKKYSSASS